MNDRDELADMIHAAFYNRQRSAEHLADVILAAGYRKAETVWGEGFEAGFDYAGNQSTGTGVFRDPPMNPYVVDGAS